jgi:hypothetical protein
MPYRRQYYLAGGQYCPNHPPIMPYRRQYYLAGGQYCPNHPPIMPRRRQYYLTGGSTAPIMPKSCLLILPKSCPNTREFNENLKLQCHVIDGTTIAMLCAASAHWEKDLTKLCHDNKFLVKTIENVEEKLHFRSFLVKNEFFPKFDDTEWFVENLWIQLR